MSWTLEKHILLQTENNEHDLSPAKMEHHKGTLVCRTMKAIYALDIATAAVTWFKKLEDKISFVNPYTLAVSGNIVMTVKENSKTDITLSGFAIDTGKEAWSKVIKLRMVSGSNNFFMWGERLVIFGSAEKSEYYMLVMVDPGSGEVKETVVASFTYERLITNEAIYFPDMYDSFTALRKGNTETEKIGEAGVNRVTAKEGLLYMYRHNSEENLHDVVCAEEGTMKELGRCKIVSNPGNVQALFALTKRGHVAVWGVEKVLVIDVLKGSEVCSLDVPKDTSCTLALQLPEGIAVNVLKEDYKGDYWMFDEFTGSRTSMLIPAAGDLDRVCNSDGSVVISSYDSIRIFTSKEVHAAAEPVKVSIKAPRVRKSASKPKKQAESGPLTVDQLTPEQKKLKELIDKFINCMKEEDEEKHKELAREFNKLFTGYLKRNNSESVGTFAQRISMMGIPYEVVFPDLIRIRLMNE